MAKFSPEQVFAEIDRQAKLYGVDPLVAKAIAVAENTADGRVKAKATWDGGAVSGKQAAGVMQVIPSTAEGLKKLGMLPENWTFDPENLTTQVQAGLAAIADMQKRVKSTDPMELVAYYNGGKAGRNAVQAGTPDAAPSETRQYMQKVRTAMSELSGTPGTEPGQASATRSAATSGTSSSTSSTTSSRQFDPNQLASALSAISNFAGPGGAIDQTIQSLPDLLAGRRAAATGAEVAITAAGKAAGDAAMAKAALETAAAVKNADILASLNLHPQQVENEAAKTLAVINQTDSVLAPMGTEIDKRMAVSIFDNPLEWMINQVRLPSMVQQYNAVARQQNQQIDRYKTISALGDSQKRLSSGIESQQITDAATALAKSEAAAAAAKLSELQLQLSGRSVAEALTLVQLEGQRTDVLMRGVKLTEERNTERQVSSIRQQQLDAVAAEKEQERMSLEQVNNMIKAAGGSTTLTDAQFKRLPGEDRQQLLEAASRGTFGKDFASAVSFVREKGNFNALGVTSPATKTWVEAAAAEAGRRLKAEEAAAKARGTKFDAKKRAPETFNELAQQFEGEAATDMRTASDSNPLKLAYDAWVKDPEFANSLVTQFYNDVGPGNARGTNMKMDEKLLLNHVSWQVLEGKLSAPAAAANIAEFYKTATKKQAVQTKYPLFGISRPEKEYLVVIPGQTLGGRTDRSINMANPAQVENILTELVARDSTAGMNKVLGGTFGIGVAP